MTAEKVTGVRGVYIRQEDLNNFGYTANCKKCHSIGLYGSVAGTMPHSVACRERIMAKLQETEAGRARVAKMTQRVDRYNCEQDLAAQGRLQCSAGSARPSWVLALIQLEAHEETKTRPEPA